MPSTYTSSLRLTLPATGENSGTWGALVNTGITSLTDTAIAGYVSIAMTDADYTLTSVSGAADQARNMMINMTGTLSAARNVICPTASKLYIIKNATTGGFAITLKTSGGSGISIPNGSSMMLMCDGTNVLDAVTQFSAGSFTNLAYTGTLTGGTGIVNLGSGQFYKSATGNVGIGTVSPTFALDVVNAANGIVRVRGGSATNEGGAFFVQKPDNTGSAAAFGDRARVFGGTPDSLTTIFTRSTPLTFDVNLAERMRLDTSGNLGLGVVPSAWRSGAAALQVGGFASLHTQQNGTVTLAFGAYESGSNTFSYLTTGDAPTAYSQITGQHRWYTAPSGTAGNAITFTQAMTLDANGNLGIANTVPSQKLDVGATKVTGSFAMLGNTTITTTIPVATSTQLGGGLVLIRGTDVSGVSFSAVYALAVRLSGGAAPDVAAATVSRAGTATPTFTFGSSGGFVTITSASNGSASYASFIGF